MLIKNNNKQIKNELLLSKITALILNQINETQ